MIDNQLPPALALHLTTRGYLASHVADVVLDAADDRTIWAYAVSNACVVVSKDEDFFYLAVGDPSGPQLVWVRLAIAEHRYFWRHSTGCYRLWSPH